MLDLELGLDEVGGCFLQYPGYLAFCGAQLLLDWSGLITEKSAYLFQICDLIRAQTQFFLVSQSNANPWRLDA